MKRSWAVLIICSIALVAVTCAKTPTEPPPSPTPMPAPLPGVTPPVPTPLPGSTPIPWLGSTIGNLEGDPKFIGKPAGLAIYKDGTIFVTDIKEHRILHIDNEGNVLNVWGKLGETDQNQASPPGAFNEPWGVATSPDGLVYVADTWNHRVQVFKTDGSFVRSWGEPGQGDGPNQLFGPRDIVVNPDGYVFVTDTGNKRIVVYDLQGSYISQIGGEGTELGQFNEPVGIALAPDGDIFVADTWNRRVQVLSLSEDGTLFPKSAWPVDGWKNVDDQYKQYICVLDQRVFLTDTEAGKVLEYTTSGELIYTYDLNSTGVLNYGLLYGIAPDTSGNLWVSDLAGGAGVLVRINPVK